MDRVSGIQVLINISETWTAASGYSAEKLVGLRLVRDGNEENVEVEMPVELARALHESLTQMLDEWTPLSEDEMPSRHIGESLEP